MLYWFMSNKCKLELAVSPSSSLLLDVIVHKLCPAEDISKMETVVLTELNRRAAAFQYISAKNTRLSRTCNC